MLEISFRIHRDEVTRTQIGRPPTAERQKWDSILLLWNGGYGATAGGNGNGATEFFTYRPKQRNSFGAYVILTEFT